MTGPEPRRIGPFDPGNNAPYGALSYHTKGLSRCDAEQN